MIYLLLILFFAHPTAKWMEGWMMVGTAVRLAIPMGLLNDTPGQNQPPMVIVEGPGDDVEREERRLTITYALTLDFAFSAPSGWPATLSHDELVSLGLLACLLISRSGHVFPRPSRSSTTE